MSKIPVEELQAAIKEIKEAAKTKKRKFVETIDLQIKLKNYDPSKDKRFSGSVKLMHAIRPKMKICVLGEHDHTEEAKSLGVDYKTVDDLKVLDIHSNPINKKKIKKMVQNYHVFLASATLIKKIPKILGPGLSKVGKFPTAIPQGGKVAEKIDDAKKTIKFQLKKEINLGSPVGSVEMTDQQIQDNVIMSINFLVSLLKKKWQNIGSINIKSTMGKPKKLYP
jgi:large subunit ribosomal protein L10Ae